MLFFVFVVRFCQQDGRPYRPEVEDREVLKLFGSCDYDCAAKFHVERGQLFVAVL